MKDTHIIDPLLNTESELIIEVENDELCELIISDIKSMSDALRKEILFSMLSMHKYYEEECGDLKVSLNSTKDITENTDSCYVILDSSSSLQQRVVRYHYNANWETSHGVEVIIVNGDNLIFVGNCGYVSSVDSAISGEKNEFNFKFSA